MYFTGEFNSRGTDYISDFLKKYIIIKKESSEVKERSIVLSWKIRGKSVEKYQ